MTQNALLELIRQSLPESGEEGQSVKEMCEATNRGAQPNRRELERLIKDGKVECVRGTRLGIDGVMRHVPLYRIKCGE